eukprot:GHVU01213340.1.p4 GENE.GHVU01213340.1~~GHVU01213340.1.p4  ORF type:complete len:112 (-),score=3.04 GHVU01213340.1:336-671(-)
MPLPGLVVPSVRQSRVECPIGGPLHLDHNVACSSNPKRIRAMMVTPSRTLIVVVPPPSRTATLSTTLSLFLHNAARLSVVLFLVERQRMLQAPTPTPLVPVWAALAILPRM